MSVEAIAWALKQKVGRSATKHVLTLMANCAAEPALRCYTSVSYLVEATELDRKTVIAAIQKLEEMGLISDAGERTGRTGQIVVYQLNVNAVIPEGGEKRNGSKNGTVPKTAAKGTKNGGKESQKRTERVPKTGHGTEGTEEEQKGTKARAGRASLCVEIPDWLPGDAWDHWLEHRKAMKAPFTQRAAELSIRVLGRLRSEGHDPVAVIDESILRGWTGLFPLKQGTTSNGAPGAGGSTLAGTWWEPWESITAMGASLGRPYDGQMNRRQYKRWVFKAAGPGPWQEAELSEAARMNEFEYERVFAYFMGEKPASMQQLTQRAADQQGVRA
ncbi:helix-turn-helix domain-containing protein [Cupriavidus nantongensis]